jgi:hypothetical protein
MVIGNLRNDSLNEKIDETLVTTAQAQERLQEQETPVKLGPRMTSLKLTKKGTKSVIKIEKSAKVAEEKVNNFLYKHFLQKMSHVSTIRLHDTQEASLMETERSLE